jgi:hypothetical protein
VTATGRPPALLAYSTRATTVPCFASSDRPNSVTSPYRPSNSPGTSSASVRAYCAYVGVVASVAKFTGSPPPMSSVSTCRRPARRLISSASSYVSATPRAIRDSGTPWDPVCACSRVSHGRSRYARTTHSRAPSSRSATPNFDVAVAVDVASMEPPPICGFTRIPSGDRLAADLIRASMRSSSCGLSALTAMPRASASRSSPGVLAGESSTVISGPSPAARASASSPGLATSAPTPSSRSSRSTGTSGVAFTAKACSTGVPGATTASNAARSSAADSRMPVTSSSPTIGLSGPSSPCSTAACTASSRRAARPAPVSSASSASMCVPMHPAKHPRHRRADTPTY